jgi:hypothetical protein
VQSPLPTVSVAKQDFDALRGTKVNRVAYGSGPAVTAVCATAVLRIAGALAGGMASNGAVVTSRCVTRPG